MGGWFHQDFDIHGETLEDVVAAFKAESDTALVAHLVDDIDAFLATEDDGMEDRFQEHFRPDVIPECTGRVTGRLAALQDVLPCDADSALNMGSCK